MKQKHFQIPKKLLRGSWCEEIEKRMLGHNEDIYEEPSASISKEPEAPTIGTVKPKSKTKSKSKSQSYNRDDFMNMEGVSNVSSIYTPINFYFLVNEILVNLTFCFLQKKFCL